MENYYNNSSRWVFDSDGNYLHSKRNTYNPNLHREGIFFTDTEKEKEEYLDTFTNIKKELISIEFVSK